MDLKIIVSLVLLPLSGFLSGSLMFSFWFGLWRGKDIRKVGDGNPGAVNAFKSAGPLVGTLGLLFDFLKGALPVTFGYWYLHISGIALTNLIVAPVLGHAFSPWLRFRGGKALAVTFGVWSGVTLYQVPVLMGATLFFSRFVLRIRQDEICVLLALLAMMVFVILVYHSPPLTLAAILNALIVAYKHRAEL
ncbi:MAG: glycerol-3-phosphate acyltransferase [candidate division WOR-3 bacterium]